MAFLSKLFSVASTGFRYALLAIFALTSVGYFALQKYNKSLSKPKNLHEEIFHEPKRVSIIEDLKSWDEKKLEKTIKSGGEQFYRWYIAQTTGLCEAHHCKMDRVWLPVAYGFPVLDAVDNSADWETAFPHPNRGYVEGGCVSSGTVERELYCCPICTDEYRHRKALNTPPLKNSEPAVTLKPTT